MLYIETTTQNLKIDTGYGATPESALLAGLQRQPAFDPYDVEYLYGRPDFMDVNVKHIDMHDWEAYSSPSDAPSRPSRGDGPILRITRPYDLPGDQNKIRIVISNVWVEVNRFEDGRADVLFHFSIELEEQQWTGEHHVMSELDKTWKCERKSTEPK